MFVAVILTLIVIGSIAIYLYLPHAMRSAAIDTARQSNLETIDQIKLMRSYYTQTIVARALKTETLKPSMSYRDHLNQIPLPATLVKDISEMMSKQHTRLGLISPYPWPHRADRVLDDFESAAWKKFQTDPDAVESRIEFIDGQRVMRVAVADRMVSQTCVDCHNSDPLSAKRDWKVGDVRAVFEVTKFIEPYLAAAEERSHFISIGILIAALISSGVLLACLVLVERRTRESLKADERAYFLAEHDALTGIGNRARLHAALESAFKDPGGASQCALVLIDLDHFKAVNDTHGHDTGDQVLKQVAHRLIALSQPGDLIARLGGDEFALLVYGKRSTEALRDLGQAICQSLGETILIDGQALSIGATVGIARGKSDARTAPDMLIAADLALYAAKGAGRGRCEMFNAELNLALLNRRKMEADLREAASRGELELHYQPIVSLETRKAVRFEALLRWHHPERGLISPATFIPIAEESGLIVPIGDWVIQTACAELARRGAAFQIAINLSVRQLQHEGLLDTLQGAVARHAIDPARLEIEITESSMMNNDRKTLGVLKAIRALGIRIAIDDFGTGYSCLSYMQNYPINCVKIDRSFVHRLGERDGSNSIITAIIALARALKLEVVAEGIETREQLVEIARLGCVHVQGFLIASPKPIDQLPFARAASAEAA
jgi:diguanylate cyclase (GGDEF)-like protein